MLLHRNCTVCGGDSLKMAECAGAGISQGFSAFSSPYLIFTIENSCLIIVCGSWSGKVLRASLVLCSVPRVSYTSQVGKNRLR